MIDLHYAKKEGFIKDEYEDIQVYTIGENLPSISSWIHRNLKQDYKTVWLVTYNAEGKAEGYEEIFVTDKVFSVYIFFELIDKDKLTNIFIQEYPSFEDAYSVSLMMKEPHELCYSK